MDPRRAAVVAEQRARLLLLQHAHACAAAPGSCRASPHCGDAKVLWRHVCGCAGCAAPHCASSGVLMAHFCGCEDARCEVCGPVRRWLRRRKIG